MLEVKNLTLDRVLNGVEEALLRIISFQVQDGEMLVITGPNAAEIYACQGADGN